jgi:hypothetical protein
MKRYQIPFCFLLCFVSNVKAQQKHFYTFQYTPSINQRSISGKISAITNSMLSDQKLTWFHIGDTVIHVWDKDLKKEMELGKIYTFNGIQKLTGVKKHLTTERK